MSLTHFILCKTQPTLRTKGQRARHTVNTNRNRRKRNQTPKLNTVRTKGQRARHIVSTNRNKKKRNQTPTLRTKGQRARHTVNTNRNKRKRNQTPTLNTVRTKGQSTTNTVKKTKGLRTFNEHHDEQKKKEPDKHSDPHQEQGALIQKGEFFQLMN